MISDGLDNVNNGDSEKSEDSDGTGSNEFIFEIEVSEVSESEGMWEYHLLKGERMCVTGEDK